MFNDYHFTADSFVESNPSNVDEIVSYLNDIVDQYYDELAITDENGVRYLDELGEITLRDRVDRLYLKYCNDELEGAPAPVFLGNEDDSEEDA